MTMIRIVNDHHGLGRPAFFCIVCREEIKGAESGNIEWPVDENGTPMGPFTAVCKEHSGALNDSAYRDGLHLRWMDLHEFVFTLLGKLTSGDIRKQPATVAAIGQPTDD